MKNTNEILERILLNMGYDSKKTLTENKDLVSSLILEQQEIPITMNQNMQFQTWIWKNVDKLGDPEKADKNKKYNTKLCSQPCTPYNRKIQGKIYPGAIDGIFGGNTKTLWNTYKTAYKKANPTWNADDIKTREKVIGKTIPTTSVEISNFQKWFLEHKENAKKDSNGLYTTKLCDKPCTYTKAVDGLWGDKTKALWTAYENDYKKLNNLWAVPIKWDKETQDAENLLRDQVALAPFLRWSKDNPSGWDMRSALPAFDANKGGFPRLENTYANPDNCPWFWGWDLNNNIFPYPKEYTKEIIDKVKNVTKKEQAREDEALAQQAKERKELESEIKAGDGPYPSDRLGTTRYRPDPLGVGPTKGETMRQSFNDLWDKKMEEAKNHILHAVYDWNSELAAVKAAIPKRCKRPMKITDRQNNDASYISYSSVCKNRGGLWVYNVGTNNEICSCRNMISDEMNQSFLTAVNGSKGRIETGSGSLSGMMAWQTEGTGGMDVKIREDSHHSAMWTELGLMAVGFVAAISGVGAPLAPLFFTAAAAVGVADGAKYIQEGDTHMGVMLISLSLLGAPEVAAAFRLIKAESAAARFIAKEGSETFKSLIKKSVKRPELLTSAERLIVMEIQEAGITIQKYLGTEIRKELGENLIKNLPKVSQKWTTKELYKFILKAATTQPKLKNIVIYVLGVPYTIDQVYLAIYGNDLDRQRSGIGFLFNWLYNEGHYPNLTSTPSNESILDREKEKQLRSQILTKLIAELQGASMNEEFIQTILSNKEEFIDNMMSDEEVDEWARSQNINTGIDRKRYDELIAKAQKEEKEEKDRVKNLEGCNQLDSLKTLATGNDASYTKIDDKFVFIKEKAKSENKDDFINGKCNDEEFFYKKIVNKDSDFMKQVQRDTKSLPQNPDYNEPTPNFDSSIEKSNQAYAKEFNKVNEDYRLQKIIRKNIKRYL